MTTVRDLGGRDYVEMAVRRAVNEGWAPGPRILAAGKAICMTGGHGWWIGRETDGPDDARKAVREQLKQGADVIKLIATGGVMTPGVEPGASQLTRDEMRAAIDEARKAGRRTAAHAQGSEGIADAVEAGITTVEHGIFLTEEIVARMKARGALPGRHPQRARRHQRRRARRRHPGLHGAQVGRGGARARGELPARATERAWPSRRAATRARR